MPGVQKKRVLLVDDAVVVRSALSLAIIAERAAAFGEKNVVVADSRTFSTACFMSQGETNCPFLY